MKQFFTELFDYNHHCNQKLADVFQNTSADYISEKALKLFSHILNAHQIWNHRIEGLNPSFAVWDVHPTEALKEIDSKNYKQSLMILDAYELSEIFKYSNTKGLAFQNSIQDILFHVINHSTYHRAQIATELKQQGIEPLSTDYIFFKR